MEFNEWTLDKESDSFHQHQWWGRLKSKFGWQVFEQPYDKGSIRVFRRKFAKIFSFAYVPFPGIEAADAAEYCEHIAAFSRILESRLPRSCIFIRFDMPLYSSEYHAPDTISEALRKADLGDFVKGANVQPPDTVMLDLSQSEEAILQAMKPKWRYNIRLAEKKGVHISQSDGNEFDIFWGLYKETSERDHIAIHSKAYYETFFTESVLTDERRLVRKLWVARYNDEPIAAIITLYSGTKATYLYGASSNGNRNVMAPYLLQWRAIQDAKASGCTLYDFYGMSPTDDPDHPMHGLYRFKTGFGGTIRHYLGCIDIPVSGFLYWTFSRAERIRSWWYKSVRKPKKSHKKVKTTDNES